jgi:hypothetical protein
VGGGVVGRGGEKDPAERGRFAAGGDKGIERPRSLCLAPRSRQRFIPHYRFVQQARLLSTAGTLLLLPPLLTHPPKSEAKSEACSPPPFRPFSETVVMSSLCARAGAASVAMGSARARSPRVSLIPGASSARARPGRCCLRASSGGGNLFSFEEGDDPSSSSLHRAQQQQQPDARPLFTLDRASAGDNLTFEDIRCVCGDSP